MDRCPSCGIDIREDQVICVNCGVQLRALKVEKEGEREKERRISRGWTVFLIIVPILIIMFLIISLPGLFA